MPVLRIELFGIPRVTWGDQPVHALHKGRLQVLLAYLVMHAGEPVSRERLAFTLWPDSSEPQARTNLRQLLHHLRRALPAECDFPAPDAQTASWPRDGRCAVDLFEFEAAAARAGAARERCDGAEERKALEAAAALYQDDLLRGLYDEWIEPKRKQLREQLTQILHRLVELLQEAGDAGAAICQAERLLTLDPLREIHYRLLMELHAQTGDRAAALRTYHQCMRVLRRELGVAPGEATRRLFERILQAETFEGPPGAHPLAASLPPMIGRTSEWGRLRECWSRAAAGESLLAIEAGEPGIGKSRLAAEFCRWWTERGAPAARARCYAARGQLAYAPVEEWLKSEPLRTVRPELTRAQLQELARVVPEVLAEHPELAAPGGPIDSWQRRHFFEALKTTAAKAADPEGGRPLLLVADDLQWCDQDSFAWLHFLLTSGARGILVLGTMRPAEAAGNPAIAGLAADLRQAGALEEIVIGPLGRNDAAALAAHVANRELDAVYLSRLYHATGGNPLFVVESVRAKLEDAGRTPEDADVPLSAVPRVQAVIAGRLTQLSAAARDLAGMAAAAGTAFSFDLLAKATDWNEESVTQALDEMWRRKMVDTQPGGAYDFSHDRLREVAYSAMSPVRQRYCHRRIAQALEEIHAGQTESISGQLASHCEAAGMADEAIRLYAQAAAVAQRRYADGEAASLLRRALGVCRELPPGRARDRQELELLAKLGNVLLIAHGYSSAELGETCGRALELSQALGEREHRATSLAGAAFFHGVCGQFERCLEFSRELIAFAEASEQPAAKATGQFMLAIAMNHLGRVAEARQTIELTWSAYRGADSPLTLFPGLDMRVFCGSYRSHILWLCGELEEAAFESGESVALARREAHPFSLALAWSYAALLRVLERRPEPARECAEEAAGICRKYGFSYYLGWSEIVAGWAMAQADAPEDGARRVQRGIDIVKSTGAQLRLPFYYSLLAEAHDAAGQAREALAGIAAGLAFANSNGERWAEPELHRVHGRILERAGHSREAAASYRQAAERALRIGAPEFARRAEAALEFMGKARPFGA